MMQNEAKLILHERGSSNRAPRGKNRIGIGFWRIRRGSGKGHFCQTNPNWYSMTNRLKALRGKELGGCVAREARDIAAKRSQIKPSITGRLGLGLSRTRYHLVTPGITR